MCVMVAAWRGSDLLLRRVVLEAQVEVCERDAVGLVAPLAEVAHLQPRAVASFPCALYPSLRSLHTKHTWGGGGTRMAAPPAAEQAFLS